MPDPSPPTPQDHALPRPARWALVIGLFCLYLALWPQGRGSIDEEFIYRTTHSLVRRGALRFSSEGLGQGAPKLVASKYGVLPSLGAVPFHLVGLALAWPAPQPLSDEVLRTATYSSSGLWMALAALQVAAALGAMGLSRKVQLAGSLLFALATPALIYARFFHVTAMATLLVAALLHAAVRFQRQPGRRGAAWVGVWLGLLLLVGFNFVVLVPVVAVFVGCASPARRVWNLLAALAPVVVGWALVIGVNLLRGHDWFRGGYVGEAFVTPLPFGLYGLLFSAGRGLFFYNPLTVAGLLLFPALWRSRQRVAWLIAAICALVTVSYAKWFAWNGGTYWGPRYLVPLLPLTVVPLAWYVARWRERTTAGRAAFVLLVLAALAVQVRGVRTHYYAATESTAPLVFSENEALFVPQLQPLWWQGDVPPAFLWVNWYRRGYAAVAIGLALSFSVVAIAALGYAGAPLWRSLPAVLPGATWGWIALGIATLALWSVWRSEGHGLTRETAESGKVARDFWEARWRWRSPHAGPTSWSGFLRVPQNGNYVLFLGSVGRARLQLTQVVGSGPEVPITPQIDDPGGPHWRTWAGRLNYGLYHVELAAEPGPDGYAEVSLLWSMHGGGIDRQPIAPQFLYPHEPSATRLLVDRAMAIVWLAVLWAALAGVALAGRDRPDPPVSEARSKSF